MFLLLCAQDMAHAIVGVLDEVNKNAAQHDAFAAAVRACLRRVSSCAGTNTYSVIIMLLH